MRPGNEGLLASMLQKLRTDQLSTEMASQKSQNPQNSAQAAQERGCAYCGAPTGWDGTLCPACLAEAAREVAQVRLERTPRPSAEMASQNPQKSAGLPSLTAADRSRLGLDQLAPCQGGCGAVTPRGWYCSKCTMELAALEVGS
jgi:predicted amidophosphoribosyltransferase